jgi:hypothetical protein
MGYASGPNRSVFDEKPIQIKSHDGMDGESLSNWFTSRHCS